MVRLTSIEVVAKSWDLNYFIFPSFPWSSIPFTNSLSPSLSLSLSLVLQAKRIWISKDETGFFFLVKNSEKCLVQKKTNPDQSLANGVCDFFAIVCLFPRYEQDQPNVDIHISIGHKPVFQPIFAVTLNYVCNAGSPGFTEAIAGVHMTTSKF